MSWGAVRGWEGRDLRDPQGWARQAARRAQFYVGQFYVGLKQGGRLGGGPGNRVSPSCRAAGSEPEDLARRGVAGESPCLSPSPSPPPQALALRRPSHCLSDLVTHPRSEGAGRMWCPGPRAGGTRMAEVGPPRGYCFLTHVTPSGPPCAQLGIEAVVRRGS